MKSINRNITLSVLTEYLSSQFAEKKQYYLKLGIRNLKKLARYILFQIDFLIQFEYSKENIKEHLLEKASAFFGLDFDEVKEKIKTKIKTKKAKKKNKNSSELRPNNKTRKTFFKKNEKKPKKKAMNIYTPPKELSV